MDKISVLLADDHAILRAGLSALLNAQPDVQVVGEAATAEEAIQLAQVLKPQVILMDISMPAMGGIAALRAIRELVPTARVLMLTMHDDTPYVQQAVEAGAIGYILKRAADSELLAGIRAASRGEAFLHPSIAKVLIEEYVKMKKRDEADAREPTDPLSPRERDVLALIVQGYSNHEIADQLVLSVKTVETHKAHIQEKLGLRTRAELVRYALHKGLTS